MDTVITNIGQLVTPSEAAANASGKRSPLRVIPSTQLRIHRGRIAEETSKPSAAPCRTLDAQGGVVLPGLIDPFWIAGHVPPLAQGGEPDLDRSEQWTRRLLHLAAKHGLTTVEFKCSQQIEVGASALLAQLSRRSSARVIGSLRVAFFGDSRDRHESVSRLIGEIIPDIRQHRSASFLDLAWDAHADFDAEARAVLRAAGGAGIRPKLHILGAAPSDALISLAVSLNVSSLATDVQIPPLLLDMLSDAGVFPVLIPSSGEPQVVSPGADDAPLVTPGALGSGNGLYGTPFRSMWDVMASAMTQHRLSLDEAITACTLGNALALERGHDLGSLEVGKFADLIILALSDYRELPSVLGFPPILSVLIEGEPVGDP